MRNSQDKKNNIKFLHEYCGKKIDPLDFNLIIADAIKKPISFVLAHPEHAISKLRIKNLRLKISRRINGEPLAYIFGHKEFYGLDFFVNKNVLIPRPETELLVEEALRRAARYIKGTFIDVGAGSGCVIISLAKKITCNLQLSCLAGRQATFNFVGIDISAQALAVARANAATHKVAKKIKFLKGDLLDPVLNNPEYLNAPNDLNNPIIITANLPYLDAAWKKNLSKSNKTRGLKFEPRIALYAGEDGLDAYRRLAEQIKTLKDETARPITLLCEIGHEQAAKMKKIFSFSKKTETKKDLAGLDRLMIIDF